MVYHVFFSQETGGTWKGMRMRIEPADEAAKANRRKALSCNMHGL